MKRLLFVLITLLFVGCVNAPDNVVHSQKSEKGNWIYDSSVGPYQPNIEYVQLAPTWGQSFYYASRRSDRPIKLIASLAFLVVFVLLFIGKAAETPWFPKALQNMMAFNAALFITLAASVMFFISDPSGIKWNNDKWIEKEIYEEAMKTGSTKPIWDSLENKCLIVEGPYNCYK